MWYPIGSNPYRKRCSQKGVNTIGCRQYVVFIHVRTVIPDKPTGYGGEVGNENNAHEQ